MGDLADLKVALWQREIHEESPRRSREELLAAVRRAGEAGADCLVANAFGQDGPYGIIPCGTATADYGERIVALHTDKGDYAIGVCDARGAHGADGEDDACGAHDAGDARGAHGGCDLTVRFVQDGWAKEAQRPLAGGDGVPAIVVGPVGMRNAGHGMRCFDGASAVLDAQGGVLAAFRDDFAEEFAPVSLVRPGSIAQPCERKLLRALVATIRRFDAQVLGGTLPWVIGLSGGLDSSIVASLLVLALGTPRVVGYSLSSEFNSAATKDNAAMLANALGVRFHAVTIGEAVSAVEGVAGSCGYAPERVAGLVHENVQARMRGSLLCTFAAIEGGVVANNANFVAAALGYCTLYGDAIGALAPIADLTTVELFDLARDINAEFGSDVVPGNLLPRETADGFEWQTMPSAELAEGQRDPMKWFYHDWLVRNLKDDPAKGAADVLRAYRADRLESAGMGKWVRFYGLDDPGAFISDIEWVLRQMHAAAFKRIQSPPAILLSASRAPWGDGEVQRRWEPDDAYLALKEDILSGN